MYNYIYNSSDRYKHIAILYARESKKTYRFPRDRVIASARVCSSLTKWGISEYPLFLKMIE